MMSVRKFVWIAGLFVAALAAPPAIRAAEECLSCHDSEDNVGDATLVVQAEAWDSTVHGAAGIACADCHAGHEEYPHPAADARASCASCHSDVTEGLAASVHGRPDAPDLKHPGCTSCHGPTHALRAHDDPVSPVHPARLPVTCGACHSDPEMGAKEGIRLVQPIAAYEASVHARAVAAGEHAATCSSCHGSHDIRPGEDPASRVNRANVPSTCAECHAEISATFAASVHGQAAARGIDESPVCSDCHGEHRILGPADKGSPVFASNVPKMTCGRCHGDLRVTEKFGLTDTAVTAFEDSFHGLAGRSGSVTVANCASCHGVHDILPSSDPRSHIAPANLAATCGNCHPGAGASFAIGEVHVLPGDKETAHPAVYWVRNAYLWLIWLTIGGMALHNLLDLRRKARTPFTRPIVPIADRRRRMSGGFRIAHGLLLTSFIALVWSGFALKYPEGWWARPLLAWEASFTVRGWLHRGAALVMLAAFAFHAVHVAIDRRARACIRNMMPTLHDVHELREKLMWYFGKRTGIPQSPPLGYAEKAEYLALVWGTLVMAVTGFILWFENWSLANLPKWASDVATVVHFYEAVLATLAIVVWHFYFVIFDPLVYPLDTTFLTGREAPGRMLERTAAVVEPKPRKDAKPKPDDTART
ncbi:MAG: cytochrome B [Thermoanaerobaculia bacterium]|nr:MAG: cytochrome B [Thermoanaerobaculia bacterium]